jgi:hypothetical protein
VAAPAPALTRRPVWPAPAVHGGGVVLRYREPGPVLVRGPVTGRPYEFSAGQGRSVDARDAEVLLRTRHFVRA